MGVTVMWTNQRSVFVGCLALPLFFRTALQLGFEPAFHYNSFHFKSSWRRDRPCVFCVSCRTIICQYLFKRDGRNCRFMHPHPVPANHPSVVAGLLNWVNLDGNKCRSLCCRRCPNWIKVSSFACSSDRQLEIRSVWVTWPPPLVCVSSAN